MWDLNHLSDLWDALRGGITGLCDAALDTWRELVAEVGGTNLVAFATVGGAMSGFLYLAT